MIKRHTRQRRVEASARRDAFTLIEILVVIGVIGILLAITAMATVRVIGGQRASNTRTTMATIQKVLSTQWAYVIDEAKKDIQGGILDYSDPGLQTPNQVMNSAYGSDLSGGARNRIIWIKARLMEAFPTSYSDVIQPYPYQPPIIPKSKRRYQATYLKALGGKVSDNRSGLTESSACLLIALSIARGGASLSAESLGSSNVADTDGDGVSEIIDGWGNALAFFRFPTDNPRLQNTNPATVSPADKDKYPKFPGDPAYTASAAAADLLDPNGELLTITAGLQNFQGPDSPQMSPYIHRIKYNVNFGAFIAPTLVSWGPNGDVLQSLPSSSILDEKGTPAVALQPATAILNKRMGIENRFLRNNDHKDNPIIFQESDMIYSFQLR